MVFFSKEANHSLSWCLRVRLPSKQQQEASLPPPLTCFQIPSWWHSWVAGARSKVGVISRRWWIPSWFAILGQAVLGILLAPSAPWVQVSKSFHEEIKNESYWHQVDPEKCTRASVEVWRPEQGEWGKQSSPLRHLKSPNRHHEQGPKEHRLSKCTQSHVTPPPRMAKPPTVFIQPSFDLLLGVHGPQQDGRSWDRPEHPQIPAPPRHLILTHAMLPAPSHIPDCSKSKAAAISRCTGISETTTKGEGCHHWNHGMPSILRSRLI